jgi:Na+/proline symporter
LVASAWTNFFQGFLIIVLSFMLIPLGWDKVGGISGIKGWVEPHKISLATPEGIGIWFIFMLTINGLIGIMAQPHMLAAVGTGKDEHACRVGFLYGNFVKRFCTVGWALVGLMVATLLARGTFGATSLADPEDAFGFACRHLLFPGALGLLIAAVLAANMSTCSAFVVDSGALFTQGFYRKHLVPGRPDRHYLWVGRVSGLLISILGVLYALFLIEKVLYSFLLTETLATFIGISVVAGIIWPRANRWGAVASLVTALATNFLLYYLRNERLDYWDPNVFFAALLMGTVSLVGVSLLTPPEPRKKVASFFARLQTPSRPFPAASRTAAPGASPPDPEASEWEAMRPDPSREAAEKGEQSLLVNLLNLRRATCGLGFFRAYQVDLTGLAMGGVLAAALVAAVALLFRI